MPKLGALSYFDYGQIEPRLTAYFANGIGYPEFAERIKTGGDSYTAVAQMITGEEVLDDKTRQFWKQTYLSLMYGGGVPAVQRYQEGTSRAEAKRIIATFHENFPAVGALQSMCVSVAKRRGYIKSLGGRRLHMEQYGEHKLLNKLIQGSAADMMKQGLINVDAWVAKARAANREFEAHMISVVHDEIQFDSPVSDLALLHGAVPVLMDAFPEVSVIVPVPVDHEVSTTSWADKIDYDEWREQN